MISEDEKRFGQEIKENMSAAFDAEGLTVSEDLIKRTLSAIDAEKHSEDAAGDRKTAKLSYNMADDRETAESSKAVARRRRFKKRIMALSGLAAACIVAIAGYKLVSQWTFGASSKADNSVAMDMAASTTTTENSMLTSGGEKGNTFVQDEAISNEAMANGESSSSSSDSYDSMHYGEDVEESYTILEVDEAEYSDAVAKIRETIETYAKEELVYSENSDEYAELSESEWMNEIWLYTENDGIMVYCFGESDILYEIIYTDDDSDIEHYYRIVDLSELYDELCDIIADAN